MTLTNPKSLLIDELDQSQTPTKTASNSETTAILFVGSQYPLIIRDRDMLISQVDTETSQLFQLEDYLFNNKLSSSGYLEDSV